MSDVIARLVAPHLHQLNPYQPGKPVEELERELGITGAIKIASNENPMGPSPRAMDAGARAMASQHLYPDGAAHELRAALAERNGVAPDRLIFGTGSNELIYLLVHAFCRPGDEVVSHKYAFISYRLAALSYAASFVEAEVDDDLSCNVDALLAAVTPRTKIVFLANPNNPTGTQVSTADFERLLEALPPTTLLVVDEAYHEYVVASGIDYPQSQRYQSDARPQLVTLRTFSKIYGLAGLRVGYGIGHPTLMNFLNRVRRPFNVNRIAQLAALAALDDAEHLSRSAEAARTGITALGEALASVGVKPYPSHTNFLLVDVGRDAGEVYELLLRQGVIVRPMGTWGLPQHLRISVGTPEQTARVTQALGRALG